MAARRIESPDAVYWPRVCSLCLSESRRTCGVDSVVRHAYGLMTDWSQQSGSRVCWECRAMLARITAFKLQAKEALRLLSAAQKCASSTELTCLSKLTTSSTMHIYYKLDHGDGQAHTEVTEVKEEIDNYEHLQQCNAWIDSVSDGHYDDTECKNDIMTDVKTSNVTSEMQSAAEFGILFNVLTEPKDIKKESKQFKNVSLKKTILFTETAQKGMESIKEKKRELRTDDSEEQKRKVCTDVSKEKKVNSSTDVLKENKVKTCTEDSKEKEQKVSTEESKEKKRKVSTKDTKQKRKVCSKSTRKERKLSKIILELLKNLIDNSKLEEFTGQTQDVLKARRLHLAMLKSRFRCLLCVKKFKSKFEMDEHAANTHSETVGEHACDICSCRFDSEQSLDTHRSAHYSMYRCLYPECDFICSEATRAVRHARRHKHDDGRAVRRDTKCDICGGEFRSHTYYLHHRKTHLSQQYFECDLCGRGYRTRRQIARHLKHHRMSYMCETCGKRCPSNSALKAHSLAHMDYSLRDFECGECNKKFINKHKLLSHLKYHSGDRPFKCSDCHREYTDEYQLKFHKKQHHSAESGDVKTKKWKRTMSLHRNKPLRTPLAQPPTDAKGAKNPINHECHICGKVFRDKVCLRTHFSIHSDARPYKCDECGKSFKVYPSLYTHKFLHTGVKPYQCNICGAHFALKGNLSWHVRTHSDEKPYDCHICHKKFKFPSNLSKHVKIHDVVVK